MENTPAACAFFPKLLLDMPLSKSIIKHHHSLSSAKTKTTYLSIKSAYNTAFGDVCLNGAKGLDSQLAAVKGSSLLMHVRHQLVQVILTTWQDAHVGYKQ